MEERMTLVSQCIKGCMGQEGEKPEWECGYCDNIRQDNMILHLAPLVGGSKPWYHPDHWKNMCSSCGRIQQAPNCNNSNCDEVDQGACFDKKSMECIPPIIDCLEHYERCASDCHSDCKCQNP